MKDGDARVGKQTVSERAEAAPEARTAAHPRLRRSKSRKFQELLRRFLSQFEPKGIEDWQPHIRATMRENAVCHQNNVYFTMLKLLDLLEDSLPPEELRSAYKALDAFIYCFHELNLFSVKTFDEEWKKQEKISKLIESGVSKFKHDRREKIRPYVELVAGDFRNVSPEKRAISIKKFLLTKNSDFRNEFNKYDHRTIRDDIRAILFPG